MEVRRSTGRAICTSPAVLIDVSPGRVRTATGSLYLLWLAGDGRLEIYQSVQSKDVFDGFRYVASFIVTPGGETVFVGLFENTGKGVAPAGMPDPVTGEDVGGLNLYDLVRSDLLAE